MVAVRNAARCCVVRRGSRKYAGAWCAPVRPAEEVTDNLRHTAGITDMPQAHLRQNQVGSADVKRLGRMELQVSNGLVRAQRAARARCRSG